jgi:hypothetical protein
MVEPPASSVDAFGVGITPIYVMAVVLTMLGLQRAGLVQSARLRLFVSGSLIR